VSFVDSPDRFGLESRRLASVALYGICGSLPEDEFDKITRLTADVMQTPICLLSVVGEANIWANAQIGLDTISLLQAYCFCLAVVEAARSWSCRTRAPTRGFAIIPWFAVWACTSMLAPR